MISLKKHAQEFDERILLLAELTACYKSVLQSIEQNLPAISEALVKRYQPRLRRLRERFANHANLAVLKEVHTSVIEQLKAFAIEGDQVLDSKNRHFKEILRSFAEATTTLAEQNVANDGRLNTFTRNFESIIDISDLAEVRKRLVKEVAGLKQVITEIHSGNRDSVAQLRAQLSHFQERLAYTEEIARTDTLSGLRNRRSGEEAIRVGMGTGNRFSIVLMDVNGFKGINDRWGHLAGDEILRQFAARLASAVRAGDVVCRWGGDEFLVLLPLCGIDHAVARSCEFKQACEGEYRLKASDKPVTLWLRVAMGVAEWQSGEQFEALLTRADQELYKAKGISRRPFGIPRLFQAGEAAR